MNLLKLELQIKELIAQGDIETSIHLLSEHFQNNPRLDEIILQSGMYHTLRRDQMQGIITYTEVQQKLNQLRANILRFIKLEAKKADSIAESSKSTTNQSKDESYDQKLWHSLARLCVLQLLRAVPEQPPGWTVSAIFQKSGVQNRKYVFQALDEMETADMVLKFRIDGTTYWKLSEAGEQMIDAFQSSVIFSTKKG